MYFFSSYHHDSRKSQFVDQTIGEPPRTLFHYHNGDQYPEGLLLHYGIEGFLNIDRLWMPEDFRTWIAKNYRVPCRREVPLPNGMMLDCHAESDEPATPEDLGAGGQPRIYYTEGFITDYSYVFSHSYRHGRRRKDGTRTMTQVNFVRVWRWDRLIFAGTAGRCLRWMQTLAEEANAKGDAFLHSEAAARGTVTDSLTKVFGPSAS